MAGNESLMSMEGADSFNATNSFLPGGSENYDNDESITRGIPQGLAFTLDLPEIKKEILQKCNECQQRGLTQSYKWLAEILFAF